MTGVRAVLRAPLPRTLLLALLILLLAAWAARAEPVPLRAHVIWVRDSRVTIAADDSLAVEPGDAITFQRHGKTLGVGQIARVYDRDLALATLAWGSLEKQKSWDEIDLLFERAAMRVMPRLRVGYPSRRRPTPFFACDPIALGSPFPSGAYRVERLSDRLVRMVSDSGSVLGPWPDTLVARTFDEAADEEIALERGELDVSVFWPGELSREMRESPKWKGFTFGTRRRGVIAAAALGPGAPLDAATLTRWVRPRFEALNRDQFRGDLEPWAAALERVGIRQPVAPSDSMAPASVAPPMRFVVDSSCPGHAALERALNRGQAIGAGRVEVRVFYVDEPFDAVDAVVQRASEMARAAGAPPDPARIACLFTVRCPVVCAPELTGYLRALGPDDLVSLPTCPLARRP